MVYTLLEICPDASGGDDCRFSARMRTQLNAISFACYTSFGLSFVFSDVFRMQEGGPPRTKAFAVFLPMISPIVDNFWNCQAALNDTVSFNQCHQHSPEGLACRDCVASRPYFDTNV